MLQAMRRVDEIELPVDVATYVIGVALGNVESRDVGKYGIPSAADIDPVTSQHGSFESSPQALGLRRLISHLPAPADEIPFSPKPITPFAAGGPRIVNGFI
jgi:hypothetical protein